MEWYHSKAVKEKRRQFLTNNAFKEKVVGTFGLRGSSNEVFSDPWITGFSDGYRVNQSNWQKYQEVLRYKEIMSSIVEGSSSIIIVCNEEGIIEVFNPEAEQTFDYKADEVIGKKIGMLIPVSISQQQKKMFNLPKMRKKLRPVCFSQEIQGVRKDGKLIELQLTVDKFIISNGRNYYLAMAKNITEQRQFQKEILQSERLAALGGMVAGVAHEINTSVGLVVTMASEMVERITQFKNSWKTDGISEQELDNFLISTTKLSTLILDNASCAVQLVRSFKSVATHQGNESEEKQFFNLAEYLKMVTVSMRYYLKNSEIKLKIDCAKDLSIKSYPGVFSQILTNLLSNSLLHAFQANHTGEITIQVFIEKGELVLIYRDNGKGMSTIEQERVFEPFFTTKKESGGTGLGMHIIFNLVTQTLKGRIKCDSELSLGTCFTITVPIEKQILNSGCHSANNLIDSDDQKIRDENGDT
ncbi:MAG: PAS domain S-box protein [Magnetococcales bacterium]|nr:PAS domain S-box protein [Magnetococcales bacterium]